MSRDDNTKSIFIVEKYHELKSSLQVIESWKPEYPNDKDQTIWTLSTLSTKFTNAQIFFLAEEQQGQ